MNNDKPIAINLMEIWLTGRELERPNALWRPCKRDNTPAADWRPMNRTVAKRAIRSGVFTVTFNNVQHLFCAREMPATSLQLADYARLKELIGMHKRREVLPPLQLPEATEVPASSMPAMEDVYAPELNASLAAVPEGTAGDFTHDQLAGKLEPAPQAVLDAMADGVIADITGGNAREADLNLHGAVAPEAHPVGAETHTAAPIADDAAQVGQTPTPLSDSVSGLATDGGVSIPPAGNTAGSTEYDSDKQQHDGGRESDRGSEVQGDARAD